MSYAERTRWSHIVVRRILKGPVFKSVMRQVAIIEDHDVPRKFWIL